jgi:hypothetical protein
MALGRKIERTVRLGRICPGPRGSPSLPMWALGPIGRRQQASLDLSHSS